MLTSSKVDRDKTVDPVRRNNRVDKFELLERPCPEIKSRTSIPYVTARPLAPEDRR